MTVNVELTDTFGGFKNKTNEILAMTQSGGMNQAIRITESTNSSSSTTGSVVTSGGVGVAKSVTIGQNLSIGQNLTIVGKLSSSIIPETTDSIDIGSSSLYWRDVYTRGMNANVVTTAASLVVPVGATGDRVATQGGIRYNTTTTLFEGYTGSDWTPLNGVIDADLDTYITAEATADADDLEFYTAGVRRMSINQAGIVTVADGTQDFDIASHDGTNGLKLGGTLVTTSAATFNKVATTGKAIAMAIVFG
jgi:hypothetical protein